MPKYLTALLRADDLRAQAIQFVPHGQKSSDYQKLFEGVQFKAPVERPPLEADCEEDRPRRLQRRKGPTQS